jgi:ethanolamine ammonia-lyase small subunit
VTESLATPDPWQTLSRFTQARIGLGRIGSSLPTAPMLDFCMAHARARDAVHTPMQTDQLTREFEDAGFLTRIVWSQAKDRAEYLRRPDLGRRLSPACIKNIQMPVSSIRRLSFVVADGLSSLAPALHALPLLKLMRPHLTEWDLDAIVIATQARVALGDEIGSFRDAEAVVVLIGERPGLNAADSLGAYLTYKPHVGRSDAERNCISNIRPAGLSYERAAHKLLYLLHAARVLGSTGVQLKDDSDDARRGTLGEAGNASSQAGKAIFRPAHHP